MDSDSFLCSKFQNHAYTKFELNTLNPALCRIFLNFAKSCILSFNNEKLGSPSSFSSHERFKLKLRVFLTGHIVAMVTYCATKLTVT